MRHKNKVLRNVSPNETLFKSLLVGTLALPFAGTVAAQEAAQAGEAQIIEEVTITGSRQIIQNTIEIKRNATTIVDGLSAADIGDLPALSIGEALETITGVASHRENGGATEVTIRGLGPFLSMTTFNGREATNGSGDRSVNFSQFPSELMSKIAVYKTQDASLIEGGVAGLIQLETLKPLDYNKQRFQLDLKGNYNPDQQNIDDSREGDLGFRGTASYVDQFEFANGSALGLSLGLQKSSTSQPEQEVRSSSPSGSSLYACINDPSVTNEGYFRSADGDCEDQVGGSSNQGYDTSIDPATGKAVSDGLPYAWAPSSRGYRQNDTSEDRDAYFVALQFQPNEFWDINLDVQLSERVQSEQRHDLNFANQKRVTEDVTGAALVTRDSGAVTQWLGETAIESNSEIYSRTEDYKGYGFSVSHIVNDRLRVSADASFSETTRQELQVSLRTQSDNDDIFDVDTPAGYRPLVYWDTSSGIPQYVIADFDVTDHTLFSDEYRVRIDSDVDRTNTVKAFRTDFEFDFGETITSIQGGLRYSEMEYLNLAPERTTTANLDDSSQAERDTIAAINQACAIDFPEDSFLSSQRSGDLITVVDTATGLPTTGSGNSWATFDTRCVTDMILASQGETFAYPDQVRTNSGSTDVTETTIAAYVMANYESTLADFPVRGNIGLRLVNTQVDAVGYRTQYNIETDSSGFLTLEPDTDADLERVTADGSYTELLPSLNIVVELSDELIARGGIFRSLSRADPKDLGFNRSLNRSSSEDVTDPNDLISISGSGNPDTDALTAWNFDASLEWYPNEDSIVAVGVYYKNFTGGFEQVLTNEAISVDGQDLIAPFVTTQTNSDTSDLLGIEFTGSHRFSYLPGYFSGLGVKASYNYADSNFEFEDSLYGSITVPNTDGSTLQNAGIVAPGNIPGFSQHVASAQLYYQIGELDMSLIYKYRSDYFQPYTSNGNRLRYVGDVDVWEARASYKVSDNIKLKLEAINLFDEPKEQYFFADDNLGEVNVYGPRIFFGISLTY